MMTTHQHNRTILPFACRINSGEGIGSPLYVNGTPRLEQFCPHCLALSQMRRCCLDDPARRARLLRRAAEEIVCVMCGKPTTDEYATCAPCRTKARERMRRERKHMKDAAHRKYARRKRKEPT